MLVLLSGMLAHYTHAQMGPPVTERPTKIAFDNWREFDADEESLIYESAFPSALQTDYLENNTVHLRTFLPATGKGPFPVVLVLHYWGATDLNLETSLARNLNRRGIAAVLMVLPYHLSRTPAGMRSGQLAIRPDANAMIETMRQSVFDVRRTLDFIESRKEFDSTKIGLAGTSLGAIVSSLAFALDDRIQASSYMLGGIDLAHILWNSSRVVREREAMRRKGYTEESLRLALTEIEPTLYLKKDDPRSSFVIGGRYDSVVPSQDTQKLIDGLNEPKQLWIDTGHFGGALVQTHLLNAIAGFYRATFNGQDYTPPTSLYSPTIRIGVMADPVVGPQIAASLDLWRSNQRGDGFAALMMTPKGPFGFLGYRISGGLNLGITISPKRTRPGLFWNLVL